MIRTGRDLKSSAFTTLSEELRFASGIPRNGALLNDVTTTGSPWRTMIWAAPHAPAPVQYFCIPNAPQQAVMYLTVDVYGVSPVMPVMFRASFPLMESTDGLHTFVTDLNRMLASISVDGQSYEGGRLVMADGRIYFSTIGLDSINPAGDYQMGIVYDAAQVLPETGATFRKHDAVKDPTKKGVAAGDMSIRRIRR
ncbi:MAG: hypothetical protein K1X53_17465 [Candidatus Sumerlaeaceae bacterium]|nr:hypothetical protein [Candidatus Sumerlaeaceae bacterium]